MKQKHKIKYGTIKQNKSQKTYSSKVITLLHAKKFYTNIKDCVYGDSAFIQIPKKFSTISNAEETILTIKKLFAVLMNLKVREVFFDYSQCEELGLCASALTDIIALECKKYRKMKNINTHFAGNYPKTEEAKKMLIMSGLPKHLNLFDYKDSKIKLLDIMKNKDQDTMTTKIIDYYDECLKTQKYGLSKIGRNAFGRMIGEVIDNCQRHSGKSSTYYAAGYFNIEENQDYGKFRLIIFDFGDTMYETFKIGTSDYTRKLVDEKIRKHTNFFDKKWNEEVLTALYLLQYNVSRTRESANGSGGKGTIDLIENFMKIGMQNDEVKPQMILYSGKSYIYFDTTYKLEEQLIDNKNVKIIAFNKDNSLDIVPDKNYVYKVNEYFPGTMISIEFYLDHKYMDQILEAEKNEP